LVLCVAVNDSQQVELCGLGWGESYGYSKVG